MIVGTTGVLRAPPLPNLALVALTSGDALLDHEDVRATESALRTLLALPELAGGDRRPLLVAQVHRPDHEVWRAWVAEDLDGAIADVLQGVARRREAFGYPPFRRWARVQVAHRDRGRAAAAAHAIVERLQAAGVPAEDLLGPGAGGGRARPRPLRLPRVRSGSRRRDAGRAGGVGGRAPAARGDRARGRRSVRRRRLARLDVGRASAGAAPPRIMADDAPEPPRPPRLRDPRDLRGRAGAARQRGQVACAAAGGSIAEAYAKVEGGEVWLEGATIPSYPQASYNDHEPLRRRKLLLHAREIAELRRGLERKGLTVVPLELYFDARGRAKLKIALARGRKRHDKRAAASERDAKREMDRALKGADR